jgi:hypothetical protein
MGVSTRLERMETAGERHHRLRTVSGLFDGFAPVDRDVVDREVVVSGVVANDPQGVPSSTSSVSVTAFSRYCHPLAGGTSNPPSDSPLIQSSWPYSPMRNACKPTKGSVARSVGTVNSNSSVASPTYSAHGTSSAPSVGPRLALTFTSA